MFYALYALWKDSLNQMKFGFRHTNLGVRVTPQIHKIVQLISGSPGIVIGAENGWIASHLGKFYAGASAPFVILYVTWNEHDERTVIWSIKDV